MISVRDLKAGRVVWECEGGHNLRLTVETDAERVEASGWDGWECQALNDDGERIRLFQHIDRRLHHYGPHLYDAPMYGTAETLAGGVA